MVVIIPARLASSRLARKVLLPLGGVPMVLKTAQIASKIGLEAIIATDSEEVASACEQGGLRAVMTSAAHESGTERIAQAAEILGLADDEIVVNLQADEPFFAPEDLAKFCAFASERAGEYFIASAYAKRTGEADENKVKVVCARDGSAMYFSRSMIPFDRSHGQPAWLHHIGVYAYSVRNLREFITLESRLEGIEKLEQLRALENGRRVLMCELAAQGFGIDSPEDYARALELLGE